MVLDLAGQTVTRAVDLLRSSLTDNPGTELEVKVDNEVVKLNVYNVIHKAGLRCKVIREGPFYRFTIKVPKHRRKVQDKPVEKAAFPIGHVSNNKQDSQPSVHQPARQPDAPPANLPTDVYNKDDGVGLGWVVIQNDQIGQRDVSLGTDLLEELVENLDTRQVQGIFLIHRGVRLLDPGFQGGRPLQALIRKNINIRACVRSAGFFDLMDLTHVPVELVPARTLLDLAKDHKLTWI